MRILFQEGAININNMPFPKHDGRAKTHVMMVSHHEMKIEGAKKKAREAKPNLDLMDQ